MKPHRLCKSATRELMCELITKAFGGVPSGLPFRGSAFRREAAADPTGSSFNVGQGCGWSAGPRMSGAQGLALSPSLLRCPLPPLSHCWKSSQNVIPVPSLPSNGLTSSGSPSGIGSSRKCQGCTVQGHFPCGGRNRGQRGAGGLGGSWWREPTGPLSPWHMCDRE